MALLAASGSMFVASTALAAAGGNNGTVQINGEDFKNGNDPHISCPVTFKWAGFDPAPQKDDYTITMTGQNPTGGTVDMGGGSNQLKGSFTGPDFTLAGVGLVISGGTPNHKGEYHVTIVVETVMAHSTDTKSKTVWLANCNAAPPPPPSNLTVSGVCSPTTAHVIDWTVTNPNSDPVTSLVVASSPTATAISNLTGGGGIPAAGSETFNTAAPLPAGSTMGATGDVAGIPVASNAQGFTSTCPIAGQAETPASVSFTDDCSGTTVNFVSADQHTSTFTVTQPLGGTDTVNGTTSKHYGVDATHGHTVVTDDKNIVNSSHDWQDPGGCQQLAADPQTSGANHCKSGINLTLSNMNGTADVTFTLTFPNGSQEKQLVRAGQLKKLTFAVKEDTTGSVTVTAPGLAKKTYTYKKNCATVLGVKHTRKPPHKPVVKGEHQQQLPFTGFDTKRALLDGSIVFFLGAVLCMLGARRREEEPLYY